MLSFLPDKLKNAILRLGIDKVSEIRIRCFCPVLVVVDGKKVLLDKFILTKPDIDKIILTVCKRSIYSYEEQIKQGYITTDSGLRIGLSGEAVISNDKISTIKNFSSLCIRIPHIISGVSLEFLSGVYKGGSVLVVSPPGAGKTTFIRDFIKNLSYFHRKNVIVVDERNEIACKTGKEYFDLGFTVDVLTYFNKSFGLNQAIRALSPDVIVLDELISSSDVKGVITAIYGGVDVVATIHAKSIKELRFREFAKEIINVKPFDYYVVITQNTSDREYAYFDKDFNKICF